jgi:starch synthase
MKKVLMIASEAVPFAKTGGLADVIGSLPEALLKKGIDVRVIIPQYKVISDDFKSKMSHIGHINVKLGWRNQYCGINEYEYRGVKFYFIDNEYYFGRDNIYGHYDEAERYAFFCLSALESLPFIDFKPDIIHCNDWQSGMIPVLLNINYKDQDFCKDIKTVFTVHNLQYQGIFPSEVLGDIFGLSYEHFTSDKLEFYGNLNFMKGGIVYSDTLTTVSPSYAREIQTERYGERLDGLLREKQEKLFGVLNGIDYSIYDPLKDKNIYKNFSHEDLEGKKFNKVKLQEELGLPIGEGVPVIAIISRLVSQKGIDLIEGILEDMLKMNLQLVVLGTGDLRYENIFKKAVKKYPQRVSINPCFNNALAHRIYAGADMFLMPSLFEPCGLGQIISLKYGAVPLVRETGGLQDTIRDYDKSKSESNGFSFGDYSANDMLNMIKRAIELYKNEKEWSMLVKRGMTCDFSWNQSAEKYIDIYKKTCRDS